MQVVYTLATPITYQLTPQQVALLQGENNVWADCGDTTVGFWRDDSLSINKAITERAYDRQQGEALANKLDATQSDIAIIIDGNQTAHTGGVAINGFVYVRNSTISGITDGVYTAAQAIPANTAIDSTYLTAVDGGGLNAVNSRIENLENNLSWHYLDKVENGGNEKTITQYLSGNYKEILLILQVYNGPIVDTVVMTAGTTSATEIRAIYRTDDNSLRYAQFVRSTGKLSVSNTGYDALLYAR